MKSLNKGFLFVLVFCIVLTGCSIHPKPPSIASVEQRFQNNYDDIQTVVEFMLNSEHEDIYINTTAGTMLVELEDVPIEDKNVCAAINRLIGVPSEVEQFSDIISPYHSISKSGNTIAIFQWGFFETTYGIAYSINGTDAPYVDYATELKPMSQAGWYYFVADYNEWRVGKRPE